MVQSMSPGWRAVPPAGPPLRCLRRPPAAEGRDEAGAAVQEAGGGGGGGGRARCGGRHQVVPQPRLRSCEGGGRHEVEPPPHHACKRLSLTACGTCPWKLAEPDGGVLQPPPTHQRTRQSYNHTCLTGTALPPAPCPLAGCVQVLLCSACGQYSKKHADGAMRPQRAVMLASQRRQEMEDGGDGQVGAGLLLQPPPEAYGAHLLALLCRLARLPACLLPATRLGVQ